MSGASKGKGLGLAFLRHIERTSALLFLLDGAKENFMEDLPALRKELEDYNWRLLSKPYIICVNKIDLWDDDSLAEWKAKLGDEYLFISAKEKLGLEILKEVLADNRPQGENDSVEQK